MTISQTTGRPFARGARKSPRHKLLAALPHRVLFAPPPNFAGLATQLSYWLNNEEGDCVTAEEAQAKGAYSAGYCGLPDLFIPDAEVGRWAQKYGFANGAALTDVLDVMAKDGFTVNGVNYKDGGYQGVDYTNLIVLQSALCQGPVKIAIDANALPSGAGNQTGWHSFGKGNYPNTDHCVGLAAYGTASFCFAALKVPVPSGVDPNKPDCFVLFTWNTYGVVDLAWLAGTCVEAWVRNPTTPGQTPGPVPTPTPTPTPTPPTPTAGGTFSGSLFGAPFHGTYSPNAKDVASTPCCGGESPICLLLDAWAKYAPGLTLEIGLVKILVGCSPSPVEGKAQAKSALAASLKADPAKGPLLCLVLSAIAAADPAIAPEIAILKGFLGCQ